MLPLYSFPHEAAIRVNRTVLAFSAVLSIITGILFGISPAWQLSRPPINELIQAIAPSSPAAPAAVIRIALLIAGQVSLTLLLMAGAGAATRALLALTHAPLGFDPDHVFAINGRASKGNEHHLAGPDECARNDPSHRSVKYRA